MEVITSRSHDGQYQALTSNTSAFSAFTCQNVPSNKDNLMPYTYMIVQSQIMCQIALVGVHFIFTLTYRVD